MLNSTRALERRLSTFLNSTERIRNSEAQLQEDKKRLYAIQQRVQLTSHNVFLFVKWTQSIYPLEWTIPTPSRQRRDIIKRIAKLVLNEIRKRCSEALRIGVVYIAKDMSLDRIELLQTAYKTVLVDDEEEMCNATNQPIDPDKWNTIANFYAIRLVFASLVLDMCNAARGIQLDDTQFEGATEDLNNLTYTQENTVIQQERERWKRDAGY